MGTLIAVYSERKKRFFPCATKIPLSTDGVRRVLASPLRYCLGSNYFYIPAGDGIFSSNDRYSWVRDREYHNFEALNNALEEFGKEGLGDVRIGDTYIKRQREKHGRFESVESFISEEFFKKINANPDVLSQVGKDDFESLCAEVFARRGFEVDLFRGSSD